jgi:hypothetical protein
VTLDVESFLSARRFAADKLHPHGIENQSAARAAVLVFMAPPPAK